MHFNVFGVPAESCLLSFSLDFQPFSVVAVAQELHWIQLNFMSFNKDSCECLSYCVQASFSLLASFLSVL